MREIQIERRPDEPIWRDVTDEIGQCMPAVFSGICFCTVPHTTVALFLYEGNDPASKVDLFHVLETLVSDREHFTHGKGLGVNKEDSHAHITAALLGVSVVLPCDKGKLALGRWQRVFMCDFKVGRVRKLVLTFVSETSIDAPHNS